MHFCKRLILLLVLVQALNMWLLDAQFVVRLAGLVCMLEFAYRTLSVMDYLSVSRRRIPWILALTAGISLSGAAVLLSQTAASIANWLDY